MTAASLRVVKVGGSLFDMPCLGELLQKWFELQIPRTACLIAGGGEIADVIRGYHQRFTLTEPMSHWMAMQAMTITSTLLLSLIPNARYVDDFSRIVNEDDRTIDKLAIFGECFESKSAAPTLVIDPVSFMRKVEPHGNGAKIKATWDVTSDSLAARLATIFSADELVLLKSTSPPSNATLEAMASQRLVDPALPRMANGIPLIRIVNLRHAEFPESRIAAGDKGAET